jgi:hypothetical protein
MTHKILYYIGAGASAYALPLARSVYNDGYEVVIPGLSHELKQMSLNHDLLNYAGESYKDYIVSVKKRFENLSKKAEEFGDVDTYAKYLNLLNPGGPEIHELKKTLSEYFSIKQILFNARDSRYIPWLVSIMDKKQFPDNVKIISWNYDFQVELASTTFGETEEVEHSGNSFTYSPPFISHYPNIDPTFSDFNSLSIIHLNGVAGVVRESLDNTSSIFQKKNRDITENTLNYLKNNKSESQIHFAWEKNGYHDRLMQHVRNMIGGTTILVVIGYSFPFFNREIDKIIFDELIGTNGRLIKIYYQDPVLNGEQLKSQFNLKPNFNIVHIENTSNFHIPFEY